MDNENLEQTVEQNPQQKIDQLKKRDDLIRKHWNEVYKSLFYKLSKSWMSKVSKDVNELVLEGMSYIGDNIDRFDETKSNFVTWATFICYKRLIDKYRIRHRSQNVFGLISKASETLHQKGEIVSDNSLITELTVMLGDEKGAVNAIKKYKKATSASFDNITIQTDNGREILMERGCEEKGYKETEWQDSKNKLIVKIEEAFIEKRLTRLQKTALLENIIPKADGKDFKTFREIADNNGFSESYVAQQVRYPDFLRVTKDLLCEVGINEKEKD